MTIIVTIFSYYSTLSPLIDNILLLMWPPPPASQASELTLFVHYWLLIATILCHNINKKQRKMAFLLNVVMIFEQNSVSGTQDYFGKFYYISSPNAVFCRLSSIPRIPGLSPGFARTPVLPFEWSSFAAWRSHGRATPANLLRTTVFSRSRFAQSPSYCCLLLTTLASQAPQQFFVLLCCLWATRGFASCYRTCSGLRSSVLHMFCSQNRTTCSHRTVYKTSSSKLDLFWWLFCVLNRTMIRSSSSFCSVSLVVCSACWGACGGSGPPEPPAPSQTSWLSAIVSIRLHLVLAILARFVVVR